MGITLLPIDGNLGGLSLGAADCAHTHNGRIDVWLYCFEELGDGEFDSSWIDMKCLTSAGGMCPLIHLPSAVES